MHVRELTIDPSLHPRGQPHLSSTSGLVRACRFLYLVADDEHHLGVMDALEPAVSALRLCCIVAGDLPRDKVRRKKKKPDMESIALLPAGPQWPDGALLVMGSGSRPNRQTAALALLDGPGAIVSVRPVDLGLLYRSLHHAFADLNIEGAFVSGDSLRLLQRANTDSSSRNACIDFPLEAVLQWLERPEAAEPPESRIELLSLPAINGVPLGLTDGAALAGGGWIFSAVAEDTANSFSDGACAGSALGWVSADGVLQRLEWMEGAPKVEGIAFSADGQLLMVTDADDPACPSVLLTAAV